MSFKKYHAERFVFAYLMQSWQCPQEVGTITYGKLRLREQNTGSLRRPQRASCGSGVSSPGPLMPPPPWPLASSALFTSSGPFWFSQPPTRLALTGRTGAVDEAAIPSKVRKPGAEVGSVDPDRGPWGWPGWRPGAWAAVPCAATNHAGQQAPLTRSSCPASLVQAWGFLPPAQALPACLALLPAGPPAKPLRRRRGAENSCSSAPQACPNCKHSSRASRHRQMGSC